MRPLRVATAGIRGLALLGALAAGCGREPARQPARPAEGGVRPSAAASAASLDSATPTASASLPSSGEPLCEPGEAEICGCPGGQSGVRRCKPDSSGYGPCDACADDTVCGGQPCTGMRSDAIGASVPGCCTKRGHCGIDVSFFAKNHGYAAGCLELDAPGEVDPACPSTDIALPFGDGETITLQGCRTRDKTCGYDVNLPAIVNLGCTASPRKLPSE